MKRLPISLIGLVAISLTTNGCDKRPPAIDQGATPSAATAAEKPSAIAVSVDATGYHPASVQAPAGKTAHLVFTRTSDDGCGQQLVFPALGIRKDLPLNQPVTVEVAMPASGSVAFTCGMDMLRGAVVIQ